MSVLLRPSSGSSLAVILGNCCIGCDMASQGAMLMEIVSRLTPGIERGQRRVTQAPPVKSGEGGRVIIECLHVCSEGLSSLNDLSIKQ